MKKHLTICLLGIVVVFFLLPVDIIAQHSVMSEEMIGADLEKLQRRYGKRIKKGDESLIVPYAEALYFGGRYQEALQMYQRADALQLPMNDKQQRNYVHLARRLNVSSPYDKDTGFFSHMEDEIRVTPFCLNSPEEDFAPFVWNDLVFITSSRVSSKESSRRRYAFTQLPYLNVYAFTHSCQVAEPDFLPADMNTILHDGPIAIAADTSLLVITRNNTRKNSQGLKTLHLDYYTRDNGEWSKGKTFPYNNFSWFVQHPYFDDNTNYLYFSSDMPGGYGGFDLYRSFWNGANWSAPENLGPAVNSKYDEVFPSIAPGGELVFSTNHIETAGGLDIAMIVDGERVLLPYPVNTVHDDFSVTFLSDDTGLFASNRAFSQFGDNIYRFEIIPAPEYPFLVRVIDKDTRVPLEGVEVSYQAEYPPLDGKSFTAAGGETTLTEGAYDPFMVTFGLSKDMYFPLDTMDDQFVFDNNRYVLTLEMEAIPEEDPVVQEAILAGFFVIYFDNHHPEPHSRESTTALTYDKTFVDYQNRWPDFVKNTASPLDELSVFFDDVEKGMQQLQWLASFLYEEFQKGSDYTIIFTSHASPLGADEYNYLLSKRRFSSVENYFMVWNGGVLASYIAMGMLDYENRPFGSIHAQPNVSADPRDLSRSIYGVEASRERKVTISWRKDVPGTEGILADIPPPLTLESEIVFRRPPASSPLYHIIVASFQRRQTAEKYAMDIRSQFRVEAFVLPATPEGYHRVSYSVFPSRWEADAALKQVRTTLVPNAWIYTQE